MSYLAFVFQFFVVEFSIAVIDGVVESKIPGHTPFHVAVIVKFHAGIFLAAFSGGAFVVRCCFGKFLIHALGFAVVFFVFFILVFAEQLFESVVVEGVAERSACA